MNTLDLPGLESVRPEDVQQYLLHAGWQKTPPHYQGALTYGRAAPKKGKVSVLVPLDRAFADYKRRMAELVDALAAFEQRSAVDVVGDLLLPPGDAIHCRIQSDAVQSGLIPLEDSIRIRQAQKQLLLACAHSELEAKTHFPRLAHAEALELLRSCREAPSARGSYRTTLLVPVDPAVGQTPVDPYPRRVTRKLMEALDETARLCETQDAEGLLSHAREGVSANFLSALSEMRPSGAQSYVEIDVAWSRARPTPPMKRTKVRFSEGVFGFLAEAGRTLRDKTPVTGVEVEGFVVRLAGEKGAKGPGVVVVAAQLPDRPGTSMVHVELGREEYGTAIDAHKHGLRVRVIGTLRAETRTLRLVAPTGWQVLGRDPLEPVVAEVVES
jgi:hypothetical protein